MNENKISVRYSKALFQTALEKNALEEVMKDLDILKQAYYEKHFHYILHSPAVKISEKKKYMESLLKDSIHEITYNFLILLIDNKREAFLKRIARQFLLSYNHHHNIKMVLLTTAGPVDDELRKQITHLIEDHYKAQVELRECVNPDLLGGFILNIDDYQFDGSLITQLQRIKRKFSETSFLN